MDPENLNEVPSPEDDATEITEISIKNIINRHESELLQLASDLGIQENRQTTFIQVLGFCHRMYTFLELLSGEKVDLHDIQNCIKQIQKLNSRNAREILNLEQSAYNIGLEYRREWTSHS